MILVPCMHCFTAVRVMGDPDEVAMLVGPKSEFWPNKYTCVSCGSSCEGIGEGDAEPAALTKMKVRDLAPQEFYAALHGLGTPDEMICDAATVRDLLKRTIKKVHGSTLPNTTRFLLEAIELEDGTKLHFAAGAAGAVVYRITRPISYTQKVLEDV